MPGNFVVAVPFGDQAAPTIAASLVGVILSPLPSRLVRGDQHTRVRGAAVDQPQRCLRAAGKQAPSGAEHQRSDHQQVLVDQVRGHQRADQHAAPHHHQLGARAPLELRHRGRNLAGQQRRVRPRQPGRGVARGDVLASVVERVLERAPLGVPGGQQVLVGAPAEQKRPIPAHPLAHLGNRRLVAVRDRPAALLEPIAGVLVPAAGSLHHAVKRHPIHHDDLSHLLSFRSQQRQPTAPPGDSWRPGRLRPLTPTRTAQAGIDTLPARVRSRGSRTKAGQRSARAVGPLIWSTRTRPRSHETALGGSRLSELG
jgi:hypothetical protein